MKRKIVSEIMLTLLLTSVLMVAFNIQPAKAQETIHIRADGSINPPTATISSVDNITYTFADNIYNEIVLQRDNIVVDGAGYTLQGSGSGSGFNCSGISNATIKNTNIRNFSYGVGLGPASIHNTVSGNNITNNEYGICLEYSSNNAILANQITANNEAGINFMHSSNNTISGNAITNSGNLGGVFLYGSCDHNVVSGNTIANNSFGVEIVVSSGNNTVSGNYMISNAYGVYIWNANNGNTFHHNNFIDNTIQVLLDEVSTNFWDDGYPSGGNFWSDYAGTDLFSGPYQNETGSDGIGDTPYDTYANNQDGYPLISPWSRSETFNVLANNQTYSIAIFSNTTIQDLSFSESLMQINFKAIGTSGTVGYSRIVFPKELIDGTFAVFVNGTAASYTKTENVTHYFIYFTYHSSTEQVKIRLTFPWDITGPSKWGPDLNCDIRDVAQVAVLFGSDVGDGKYDKRADVSSPTYLEPDGEVDIRDIALVAKHFGETCYQAPIVYFDKNVYSPNAEVFWRPDVIVPMEVKVIDYNVDLSYVEAKISSSVDSKEMTLARIDSGVFMGTVFAVGLRLDESISNTSSFNVRYGDVVTVQYFDTFKGSNPTVSALFTFPTYVLDGAFTSLDPWKLFDSEGVPLVNYGPPIGIQYNPVTTSQYALANYYLYMTTGNSAYRETFLVQANWLVKNAEQKGNFSVWEYKFNWPDYKATNPWVSAMAQGQGLSVLTRAHVLTGNSTYLDVAQTAMRSFEVEMNSSGVRYTDSSGIWFEEVADAGAPSSKVLNGFIFALLGLYEYSFLTNSSKGYILFWEGTNTLSVNIYRYDTGSWSYYDLLYYRPASLGYHKIHVDQLRVMYELTSFEIFLVYSNKFQSYIH